MHAGQIAPKQYQVLENLTGLMNVSYNSSACVSYMLYPEVFSVDMPYKYLNLTYCDFDAGYLRRPLHTLWRGQS